MYTEKIKGAFLRVGVINLSLKVRDKGQRIWAELVNNMLPTYEDRMVWYNLAWKADRSWEDNPRELSKHCVQQWRATVVKRVKPCRLSVKVAGLIPLTVGQFSQLAALRWLRTFSWK